MLNIRRLFPKQCLYVDRPCVGKGLDLFEELKRWYGRNVGKQDDQYKIMLGRLSRAR